ncbi:TetR/AcrR family transcriptional regulator [Elongatibacter sediminis]|uniref:TetR/AcrR family transcriptional regulator n=1 Tax=Elongatibacter sediminis TaxID=3119006 RepID=A0AAW9R4S3_9GAMM
MAQVRKEEVRNRILDSALVLFEEKGYLGTTLNAIAKHSNTSIGSIYVYFNSKVELFFELYGPWLKKQLVALHRKSSRVKDPAKRLERIILGLWYDIPVARNQFTNSFIQALSSAKPEEFNSALFVWCTEKLKAMIEPTIPPERAALLVGHTVTDILFMAFDGYAINYKFGMSKRHAQQSARVAALLLRGDEIEEIADLTFK